MTIQFKKSNVKRVTKDQMYKELNLIESDKSNRVVVTDINSKEYRKEDQFYICPIESLMNNVKDAVLDGQYHGVKTVYIVSHMNNEISYQRFTKVINEVLENDTYYSMLVNSINRFNVDIKLITYKNVKELTTV